LTQNKSKIISTFNINSALEIEKTSITDYDKTHKWIIKSEHQINKKEYKNNQEIINNALNILKE